MPAKHRSGFDVDSYVSELISVLNARNTKLPQELPISYPGYKSAGPYSLPEQANVPTQTPKKVAIEILRRNKNGMAKLNVYRECFRVCTSKPFQLFCLDAFWWLFLDHCAAVDLAKLRRQRESGVMQTTQSVTAINKTLTKIQTVSSAVGGGGDPMHGGGAAMMDDATDDILCKSFSVRRKMRAKRNAADGEGASRALPMHLFDMSDTESVETNVSVMSSSSSLSLASSSSKRKSTSSRRQKNEILGMFGHQIRKQKQAEARRLKCEQQMQKWQQKRTQQQGEGAGGDKNHHEQSSSSFATTSSPAPPQQQKFLAESPGVIYRDSEWRRSPVHLAFSGAPAARSIRELREALAEDVENDRRMRRKQREREEKKERARGGDNNRASSSSSSSEDDENDDDDDDDNEEPQRMQTSDLDMISFKTANQVKNTKKKKKLKNNVALQNKMTAQTLLMQSQAPSTVFENLSPSQSMAMAHSSTSFNFSADDANDDEDDRLIVDVLADDNEDGGGYDDVDDGLSASSSASSSLSSAASSIRTIDDVFRIRHFAPTEAQNDLFNLPADIRRSIVAREQHVLFTRMAERYVEAMSVKDIACSRQQDALIQILPEMLSQIMFVLFYRLLPCFREVSATREFQNAIFRTVSYWMGGVERECVNPFLWKCHLLLDDGLYAKMASRGVAGGGVGGAAAAAQQSSRAAKRRRLAVTKSFAKGIQRYTDEYQEMKRVEEINLDYISRKHHRPQRFGLNNNNDKSNNPTSFKHNNVQNKTAVGTAKKTRNSAAAAAAAAVVTTTSKNNTSGNNTTNNNNVDTTSLQAAVVTSPPLSQDDNGDDVVSSSSSPTATTSATSSPRSSLAPFSSPTSDPPVAAEGEPGDMTSPGEAQQQQKTQTQTQQAATTSSNRQQPSNAQQQNQRMESYQFGMSLSDIRQVKSSSAYFGKETGGQKDNSNKMMVGDEAAPSSSSSALLLPQPPPTSPPSSSPRSRPPARVSFSDIPTATTGMMQTVSSSSSVLSPRGAGAGGGGGGGGGAGASHRHRHNQQSNAFMIAKNIEQEADAFQHELKRTFQQRKHLPRLDDVDRLTGGGMDGDGERNNNNNDIDAKLLGSSRSISFNRGTSSERDLRQRSQDIRSGAGAQRRRSTITHAVTIEDRERNAGRGVSVFATNEGIDSSSAQQQQTKKANNSGSPSSSSPTNKKKSRDTDERSAAGAAASVVASLGKIQGQRESSASSSSAPHSASPAAVASSSSSSNNNNKSKNNGVQLQKHIVAIRDKLDARVKSVPWYGRSNQRVSNSAAGGCGGAATAHFLAMELSPLFQRFAATRSSVIVGGGGHTNNNNKMSNNSSNQQKSSSTYSQGGVKREEHSSFPVRPPHEVRGALTSMRWSVVTPPSSGK